MKPRPILKVIEAIIKLIPENVQVRPSLLAGLEKVKESAPYKAPEAIGDLWENLYFVLADNLGEGDYRTSPDWQKEISDLIQFRINYEDVLRDDYQRKQYAPSQNAQTSPL